MCKEMSLEQEWELTYQEVSLEKEEKFRVLTHAKTAKRLLSKTQKKLAGINLDLGRVEINRCELRTFGQALFCYTGDDTFLIYTIICS